MEYDAEVNTRYIKSTTFAFAFLGALGVTTAHVDQTAPAKRDPAPKQAAAQRVVLVVNGFQAGPRPASSSFILPPSSLPY